MVSLSRALLVQDSSAVTLLDWGAKSAPKCGKSFPHPTRQFRKPLGDFLRRGADELAHDDTVAQEHQRRPQLDSEGPAQRTPLAILDRDVPHAGMRRQR